MCLYSRYLHIHTYACAAANAPVPDRAHFCSVPHSRRNRSYHLGRPVSGWDTNDEPSNGTASTDGCHRRVLLVNTPPTPHTRHPLIPRTVCEETDMCTSRSMVMPLGCLCPATGGSITMRCVTGLGLGSLDRLAGAARTCTGLGSVAERGAIPDRARTSDRSASTSDLCWRRSATSTCR
jgi:hypothetical protein